MPSLSGGFVVLPLSQVCVRGLLLGFKEDSRAEVLVKQQEPDIIRFSFILL